MALMYIMALCVFLFSTIPHKRWVFLSVMVICAGIQPGLIVKRSIRRIKGTMLALVLMMPVLYLVQINYRLIPVLLIGSAILMVVSGMNSNRYDIKVFFTTFFVFLLTALTVEEITAEGPVEMVLNRAICTLIGVAIILSADYFLFDSYRYGRKLYFFHQLLTYRFLKKKAQELREEKNLPVNRYTYISRLRDETNERFSALAKAAESLVSDLSADLALKKEVAQFQGTLSELRRLLFATCFARLILNSPENLTRNLVDFDALMSKAQSQMLITMHDKDQPVETMAKS
ncbi:integral membrane protein, YccS/YhfK family [Legionella londiniensis]|uniref:Integral membrane bound transporter domain-containing protein n=1 Tax=Legionella londiniensis TaxID=45068 RepID=A0A0W0VJQ3_9GAMM|nr:hypothetical protein Llon_1699 [Legionella londiniensis]STX93949.1 integral membrane protein, YccS/YhfK family [Legionella londiniensis]